MSEYKQKPCQVTWGCMSPDCECVVLYLVTVEHLLHHAFMFRRVVAVVGGCEGSVRTGAERKRVFNQQVTETPKQKRNRTGQSYLTLEDK